LGIRVEDFKGVGRRVIKVEGVEGWSEYGGMGGDIGRGESIKWE
jgi:hypothetical protein